MYPGATVERNEKVTLNTIFLFIICFSVFCSGFKELRPKIGPLTLQPYLIPLSLGFLLFGLKRFNKIPLSITNTSVLFLGLFCASMVQDQISFSIIIKLVASIFVLISIPLLVKSKLDFQAGALGILFAVTILAYKGLQSGLNNSDFEVIDLANKNSYSLYALGPTFLAVWVIFSRQIRNPLLIVTMITSCIVISTVILISGNRSGWLGLFVIVLMFSLRSGVKPLIFSFIIALGVYLVINYYSGSGHLEDRYSQTTLDNKSDNLRLSLMSECLVLGIKRPILGAGPIGLTRELSTLTKGGIGHISPHNLWGFLLGGTGILSFSIFIYLGLRIASTVPKRTQVLYSRKSISSYLAMRMLLILFIVRAFFAEEIIFIPGFPICFGLMIGLGLHEQELIKKIQKRHRMRVLTNENRIENLVT